MGEHTVSPRAAGAIYLVPAVSVVLAWLMLGETPRALALLGGALCLVGVAVAGGLVRIRSRDAPSGRRRRRRPRLHSRESPAEP